MQWNHIGQLFQVQGTCRGAENKKATGTGGREGEWGAPEKHLNELNQMTSNNIILNIVLKLSLRYWESISKLNLSVCKFCRQTMGISEALAPLPLPVTSVTSRPCLQVLLKASWIHSGLMLHIESETESRVPGSTACSPASQYPSLRYSVLQGHMASPN